MARGTGRYDRYDVFVGRNSTFRRNVPHGASNRPLVDNSIPAAPFGTTVDSLSIESLDRAEDTSEPRIRGCELVTSFNLLEKPRLSIAVPGMPPKWTPLRTPPQLRQDSGTYYRDINAAHNPQGGPWQATVETLMRQRQTMDPFDVLACGSTLGHLLRFVLGKPQPFRMLAHNVAGVLHLTRREASPKTTIPDVYGYGHTFPEAYTTWDKDVKGSTSHQRVVRYVFAGLNMVVRFEADGYLADLADTNTAMLAQNTRGLGSGSAAGGEKETMTVDKLDSVFAELGRRRRADSTIAAAEGESRDLQITDAGSLVPQRALFDLKTRSIKRKDAESEILSGELPRLWIRQIPQFILAYHQKGRFLDINVKDVREDVTRWEDENQRKLGRLVVLLRRIMAAVQGASSSGKLEITWDHGDTELRLREQLSDAPALFPSSTAAKWEEWLLHCRSSQTNAVKSSQEDKPPRERSTASGDLGRTKVDDEKKKGVDSA